MKKLIIAAFAAMLGIAANAAAVSWSMTEVQSSPTATVGSGWTFYVLDASTYAAFTALDGDKVAAFAIDNAIISGATKSSRGKVSASVTGGDYANGSTLSSYMVIFDNANAASASYYAYTTTSEASINDAGAEGNMNFGTFTAATSTTGGWQSTAAVPEPTSGLLMLVGLAGLALRRKRA